ncbi:MAG TPA: twin-arginine translocase TatA/TatE family subunit [Arachidicoccus sp.]
MGSSEILLIAIAVLVLFGSKKIPEFMRGLGHGVREFNNAKDSVRRELENGLKEKENVAPQNTAATAAPSAPLEK